MEAMRNIRWWHGSALSSVGGMAQNAVLGMGRMGAAIARRLLDTGHEVRAARTPAVPGAEVIPETEP